MGSKDDQGELDQIADPDQHQRSPKRLPAPGKHCPGDDGPDAKRRPLEQPQPVLRAMNHGQPDGIGRLSRHGIARRMGLRQHRQRADLDCRTGHPSMVEMVRKARAISSAIPASARNPLRR